MKKVLSILFILSFLLSCFAPTALAADANVGELRLSQEIFAPSSGGKLYIYLPVQSGTVNCVLTIYDASGRVIARFSRDGLTQNVHTFIWDVKPAYGNAAGYASDSFVPDGIYSLEAICTSGNESICRTALCTVDSSAAALQPESGVPNYTGDYETDYMVSRVLEEIPTAGLSAYDKIRAVYTWVQANCYRTGEQTYTYFDLDALRPEIVAEGTYADSLHAAGQINYDVLHNLYVANAKELLLYRIGSCLEFSALIQVLLARLGIECWIVDGDFFNSDGSVVMHKWNYLRIDGDYYWSDVRIDNASYDRSDRTQLYYDYFLESDTELWAERHGWDRAAFPELTTATPALAEAPVETPELPAEELPELPEETVSEEIEEPEETAAFDPAEAIMNTAPIYIDGIEYSLEAYTINGYNYFKLRDLAFVLTGTSAQFEVVWLSDQNSVALFSAYPYTPVGGELTASGISSVTAEPSSCQIYIDGDPVSLTAYLIQSNNYFRLRDIGAIFDFQVDWDAETGAILIGTESFYE